MSPLLDQALKGDISALIQMTVKIQKQELEKKDEFIIANNEVKEKNPAYYWMRYLQACLYAFGSNNIKINIEKFKKLFINDCNEINPAKNWLVNLVSVLDDLKMVDTEKENLERELEKAVRSDNPLALYNRASRAIIRNDWKNFIILMTPVYPYLSEKDQKEIIRTIDKQGLLSLNSKPDLDLFFSIGNFYKQINDSKTAQIWFQKADQEPGIASYELKTMLSKLSPAEIEKELKVYFEKLKLVHAELDSLPDLELLESEINLLKTLKQNNDQIAHYISHLSGANQKKSILTVKHQQLMNGINEEITKIDKKIKKKDKYIGQLIELMQVQKELSAFNRMLEITTEQVKSDCASYKNNISKLTLENKNLSESNKKLEEENIHLKEQLQENEKQETSQGNMFGSFTRK
jgi:hypothetical protein